MAYRLTQAAENQIDAILLTSARLHGIAAAGRYRLVLPATLVTVGDNPLLPGSGEVPYLPGIRAYPTPASVGAGSSRHAVFGRHDTSSSTE